MATSRYFDAHGESSLVDHAMKHIVEIPPWEAEFVIHIFHLNEEGPIDESTNEDEEETITCQQTALPCKYLVGTWES